VARSACPVCGGPFTHAFFVSDRNRGLGPGHFDYCRCSECATIFIDGPPADLGRYYASKGYGSGTPSAQELGYERAKLALVRAHIAGGHLVEIGPGPGGFTRLAAGKGFEVTAIERDPDYSESLSGIARVGAVLSDDPADALAGLPAPADAIVMWHVLEHLPDPLGVLDACSAALRPKGLLAISTPNPMSLQLTLMGKRWMHIDAPRHLQLIPLPALRERLSERGLTMVEMTTVDPVGKALNLMGWERALRPASSRAPRRLTTLAAAALTVAAKPVESRGLKGSAYTALFVNHSGRPGARP
jgi:SAM-dependent methyltransferase